MEEFSAGEKLRSDVHKYLIFGRNETYAMD